MTSLTIVIGFVTVVLAIFASAWLNQRAFDRNLEALQKQFEQMEKRFEERFVSLEKRFEERLLGIEQRLDRIERQLEQIFKPILPR